MSGIVAVEMGGINLEYGMNVAEKLSEKALRNSDR